MMYRKHSGLNRHPFGKEIEPEELFPSSGSQELAVRLGHLIEMRGIGLITGDSGSGKTSACRKVVAALHTGLHRVVYGAHVPLIVGWNRDEGALHTIGFPTVTREERDAFVRDSFGEAAVAPLAERYMRVGFKESLGSVVTEGAFVCQSRRAARAHAAHGAPVYVYELTHTLENPRFHPMGATHQVELWFVFGNEEAGIALAPSEFPLSRTIMDAWGRFARTGDPNGPGLSWPRYTAERDELILLDSAPTVASGSKSEVCAFWDRFERPLH